RRGDLAALVDRRPRAVRGGEPRSGQPAPRRAAEHPADALRGEPPGQVGEMTAAPVPGAGAEPRRPRPALAAAEPPVSVQDGYVDAVGARLGVQVGQTGAPGRIVRGGRAAVLE